MGAQIELILSIKKGGELLGVGRLMLIVMQGKGYIGLREI